MIYSEIIIKNFVRVKIINKLLIIKLDIKNFLNKIKKIAFCIKKVSKMYKC
jgi:hypothetical protein